MVGSLGGFYQSTVSCGFLLKVPRQLFGFQESHPHSRTEKSEEELKGLLMKVKEESEKVGLTLKFQKTKIMASGPITSQKIDGETMETVTQFIFLGSKITADVDFSHEIKICLLLGRKAMINPDKILKTRDLTLPTKVHLFKAMVFQQSCMDVRLGL